VKGVSRKQEDAMTKNDIEVDVELVSCEICLREVPLNEATNPETEDYIVHFCGLECFEQWKRQNRNSEAQEDNAASKIGR
jgi:hypothetical protein